MSDSDPRTADAASPGDPTPTYLIGYDGSPASHAAIELAQRLAQIVGARVVAANVYGAIPVSFAPYGSARLYGRLEATLRHEAEAMLDRLGASAVERRAVCATSVAEGLHELAA